MRLGQRTPGSAGGCLITVVAMLSAAHAAPLEKEEPNLDAKLGGITALLPVVDARPAGMAAIKVQESAIQDEVRKILRSSTVRVITEEDALKSMKGVAVVHLSANALVDEKAQVAAIKVEVECLRPAVIDRRKYTPAVIVWKTGGIGLYPVKEAEQGLLKAVSGYVGTFVAKLEAASSRAPRPRPGCPSGH
jgi:hypothetical protein